jgi:hypothetical protein
MSEHAMAVKGFVILTLAYHREGRNWIGECLELGTSTYGRSWPRVHNELIELTELHLQALEDAGERARFFREHNITLYTDHGPEEVRPLVRVDSERLIEAHRLPVGASS